MTFGHHPDSAIDFCVEVEEIIAMACNRKVGFAPEPALDARHFRAMQYRVGGDEGAVNAKHMLRNVEIA